MYVSVVHVIKRGYTCVYIYSFAPLSNRQLLVCVYIYANIDAIATTTGSDFTINNEALCIKNSLRIHIQRHHATILTSCLPIAPQKENHPHDTLIKLRLKLQRLIMRAINVVRLQCVRNGNCFERLSYIPFIFDCINM